MNLQEMIAQVQGMLQDPEGRRYPATSLAMYLERAQEEWMRLTEYPRVAVEQFVVLGQQEVPVPEQVAVIKRIRLNGQDMPFRTSSEMDKLRGPLSSPMMGGIAWRNEAGSPLHLILDTRTSRTFQPWPFPTEEQHLESFVSAAPAVEYPYTGMLFLAEEEEEEGGLVPEGQTAITWVIEGVQQSQGTFRQAADPTAFEMTANGVVPEMYQEALVYGALERSYQVEHEERNIGKANLWRSKFLEIVGDCQRREGLNALSHNEGVNTTRLQVPMPFRANRSYHTAPIRWSP